MLSISTENAPLLLAPRGELGRSPEEQRFGSTPEAFGSSRHWDGRGGEGERFLQALHGSTCCDGVPGDVECASSKGGRVESDSVKCDFCSVGGLHSLGILLSQMSGDK